MYFTSAINQTVYGVGLVQVLETALKQLLVCFQSVTPQAGTHPTIALLTSPKPPHLKLKITGDNIGPSSDVPSKIRLKDCYLATTILCEIARNYSETYCMNTVGYGMRSRLFKMIYPRGLFLLFEKGVLPIFSKISMFSNLTIFVFTDVLGFRFPHKQKPKNAKRCAYLDLAT